MKNLNSILLLILGLTLASSSCKKHIVKPADQLSLLPPATQTGANTFGCLVNGQAYVPKNRSILEGPIMQCNYIYLRGGYYFNVSGGNDNSTAATAILVQTDSLFVKEGQPLILREYATPGAASGTYAYGAAGNSGVVYHTNQSYNGQLNVTHLDTIKQIVSGTFYFTAINDKGDTVKITDGRFDMHYTR
jgi:hypothetical protein